MDRSLYILRAKLQETSAGGRTTWPKSMYLRAAMKAPIWGRFVRLAIEIFPARTSAHWRSCVGPQVCQVSTGGSPSFWRVEENRDNQRHVETQLGSEGKVWLPPNVWHVLHSTGSYSHPTSLVWARIVGGAQLTSAVCKLIDSFYLLPFHRDSLDLGLWPRIVQPEVAAGMLHVRQGGRYTLWIHIHRSNVICIIRVGEPVTGNLHFGMQQRLL